MVFVRKAGAPRGRRRSRSLSVRHLGSAHTEAELSALLEAARARIYPLTSHNVPRCLKQRRLVPVLQPEVVFWQNALSIHQAPLIRSVSDDLGVSVVVVAYGGIPNKRRRQGWEEPSYGGATVHVIEESETSEMLRRFDGGGNHVFSGIGAYPGVTQAMIGLDRSDGPRRFVLTEAVDPRGPAGILRRARFHSRIRAFDPMITRYLAIGPRAYSQLERAGVDSSRISAFGYFVDSARSATAETLEIPHIVYVGQYIERKNPMVLIDALNDVRGLPWVASFVGSGPLQQAMERRVEGLGLDQRIGIHGNLSNAEVRSKIRSSDALVLPSRHDGWGAVINEALMVGVPVLVSTQCGASSLVTSPLQGYTFDSRSRRGLVTALSRMLSERRSPEDRVRLERWSKEHISPIAAARYLIKCLRLGNESAPWST